MNMTRYKDGCSGSRSSVKDYQTRFEIAAQKITEIKNSQEYAFMTADIQEYEKRAAGLKEIYENSNRLSGCIGYLERIQALSENVLKISTPRKTPASPEKIWRKLPAMPSIITLSRWRTQTPGSLFCLAGKKKKDASKL